MNDRTGGNEDGAVAAAYDARAAEYIALIGSIDQMERADIALIAQWRDATAGALLDVGCGPGLWSAFLADPGPDRVLGREVVGVDLSSEFIAAARARHSGPRFEIASILDLPFPDGSFGGILAWYSLIHLVPKRLPGAIRELARVLAPGGRFLIGFFDGEPGEQFAHAVTPAYFWSADALISLLQDAGLTVVQAERREREPGAAGSVRPHGAIIAER